MSHFSRYVYTIMSDFMCFRNTFTSDFCLNFNTFKRHPPLLHLRNLDLVEGDALDGGLAALGKLPNGIGGVWELAVSGYDMPAFKRKSYAEI